MVSAFRFAPIAGIVPYFYREDLLHGSVYCRGDPENARTGGKRRVHPWSAEKYLRNEDIGFFRFPDLGGEGELTHYLNRKRV